MPRSTPGNSVPDESAGKVVSIDLAAGLAQPASRWRDLVAGLCVAGLLLPEAVAYAGLARLPVAHALTAVMVGLAIYGLFGGSRFAIVAPTSAPSQTIA